MLSRIAPYTRRIAFFSFAVLGMNQPAHSGALEGPVYWESYQSETSYPTSPEIDRLTLGGMIGYVRPVSPLKPLPILGPDGVTAQAVSVGGLSSPNNEIAATAVAIDMLISRQQPFAAFGHFDAFRVTPAADPLSFGAGGVTSVYLTAPNGYAVAAFVFEFVGQAGQKFVTFGVQENSRIQEYPLQIDVEGVPFDLELVVDPTGSGTARARLTVNGQVSETDPLALINYQGQASNLNFLSQAVLIQNNTSNFTFDWGAGDTVSALFRGLCISGLADGDRVCRVLNKR